MRRAVLIVLAASLMEAHRLDEYLQATLISVTGDQAKLEVTLTPGAQLADWMLALVDRDRDGRISSEEPRIYASRVTSDLLLSMGTNPVPITLLEWEFPAPADVREGMGSVRLRLRADLPRTGQRDRELHFENRHLPGLSVYLVNALVPPPGISIEGQDRDDLQSSITVRYSDTTAGQSKNWLWAGLGIAGFLGGLARRWDRALIR